MKQDFAEAIQAEMDNEVQGDHFRKTRKMMLEGCSIEFFSAKLKKSRRNSIVICPTTANKMQRPLLKTCKMCCKACCMQMCQLVMITQTEDTIHSEWLAGQWKEVQKKPLSISCQAVRKPGKKRWGDVRKQIQKTL
jgi:hypothetical protein